MQELNNSPNLLRSKIRLCHRHSKKKIRYLKFEAAVGMSRKWDAREAGREVAETAITTIA